MCCCFASAGMQRPPSLICDRPCAHRLPLAACWRIAASATCLLTRAVASATQTVPASQVLQQLAGWLDAFATYVSHLLLPILPSSWLWLADTSLCAWAAQQQACKPRNQLRGLRHCCAHVRVCIHGCGSRVADRYLLMLFVSMCCATPLAVCHRWSACTSSRRWWREV
jgi:hypothetical protein